MGGSEGAAKDGEEFDDGVPGRKNSSSFGLSSRRETLGLRRGWRFIEQRGVGLEGSGLPLEPVLSLTPAPTDGQ